MQAIPTNTGLIPIKAPDPRRFSHSQFFGSMDPALLPRKGLGRVPISIENQSFTNFCTAFCTSTAGEYIEKMDMSPEWSVAKISEFLGYAIVNGAPALAAMKAACLFGLLPKKDAPVDLSIVAGAYDPVVIADPQNWPKELQAIANNYKMGSFFDVLHGPLDSFDNLRVALKKAKDDGEERVVMAFTQWWSVGYGNGQGIIRRGSGGYSWHAHLFIDWTEIDGELVMVEQNSYGTAFGKGGLSYWSREVINQLAEDNRNECYMFRDINPADVKDQQWTLAVIIYDFLTRISPTKAIEWLNTFIYTFLVPPVPPPTPPAPTPAPEPTPAPTPAPAPAPVDSKKVLLQNMCLAIKKHEGWFEGSRSYRNNNPGNARFSRVGYLPKYGEVREDRAGVRAGQQGFAIFKDYATGYMYLQNLVLQKAANHPDWSLQQFFGDVRDGWAPDSDGNNSKQYAKVVAAAMRVDPVSWRVGNLL